ncbi:alpha/beta hydrolase [uncultured Tateyamaria sp.]|uniref:alpha/beta fold hydrolase n=1 Tax=uncultured Tateyamaria sp. TaxID=455651 RepID=UPI00262DF7CC|nr:alpha/beta hydrolase [uncultured Tateyamaria sp.]
MTGWHLPERFQTSAGFVAAGRSGTGPALVLAHGWPWSSFSWHRVIARLSEQFTVHWYDMPDFGASEHRADRPSGIDAQAQVLAEMLDHFDLRAPIVWAHDFGGAITLRAHLMGGVEYTRLVLMNVVMMRPWGSGFFDHVKRHVDVFSAVPPHIHRGIVEAYIGGAFAHGIAGDDMEQLVAPWLDAEGQIAFYRQFAQADEALTAAFEDKLDQVRCPVHILWGADDPWIPLARGRELALAMDRLPMTELPGLGHMPQLENADATLRAALPALAP